MAAGVIWYVVDGKTLGDAGVQPSVSGAEDAAVAKKQFWMGAGVIGALVAIVAVLQMTGAIALTTARVSNAFGVFLLVGIVRP